ncbi:MAG: PilZ domain-containing protein [Desulfobulbales bacterium]|nr:PilZ domain-containing protein [Desulfobulbales bacterium]
MSEPKKIFIRYDNTALLECPYCNEQRKVDADLFRGQNRFSVKCCKTFDVIIKEPKKIYVRPDNTVVLTCPHCDQQREVHVDMFRGKRRVNVKCCNSFQVFVEFRKRVRKRIQLQGSYINHSQNDWVGELTIEDLSLTGLLFTCSFAHLFQLNDELTIEFMLDDEYQTVIRKEAIVRNIRKNSVGCEFTDDNELYFTGPLGYYVMYVLP